MEIVVRVLREQQRRFSIPKPIRELLEIEPGDFLKIAIEKVEKP